MNEFTLVACGVGFMALLWIATLIAERLDRRRDDDE